MSCEPIADQAAARAIPLKKVRQAGATTAVLGTVKAARTRKLVRAIDKPAWLQTLDDAFNAGRGGHGGTAEAGRWRNLAWRWFTEWLTAAGVATCWTPRPMNAHTASAGARPRGGQRVRQPARGDASGHMGARRLKGLPQAGAPMAPPFSP